MLTGISGKIFLLFIYATFLVLYACIASQVPTPACMSLQLFWEDQHTEKESVIPPVISRLVCLKRKQHVSPETSGDHWTLNHHQSVSAHNRFFRLFSAHCEWPNAAVAHLPHAAVLLCTLMSNWAVICILEVSWTCLLKQVLHFHLTSLNVATLCILFIIVFDW